jgi:UDP-N-acetyl-2-amino-2-deoxyglucuronate dehydrogenase
MGRISRKHVEAISGRRDLHLWGICDTDPAKLEGDFTSNPMRFSSLEEALAHQSEIGLVSILTPSFLHSSQAITVLQSGIPVLVEKPMAMSSKMADAIVAESRASSLPAFVVKQNRLNEAIIQVRNALDSGALGELVFASARVYWSRDSSYYREGGWRMYKSSDGGVVWNQASHYVDLLQLLLGRVESVQAMGKNFLSPADSEDTVFAHLISKRGAFGSLEATTAIRPSNFEGSLTVSGTKGIIRVGGHALNRIDHWGIQPDLDFGPATLLEPSLNDVYGSSHRGVYDSVVRHLKGEHRSEFEAQSGVHVIEIMEAIDQSIAHGSAVRIATEEGMETP